jgi:hypothetical protein
LALEKAKLLSGWLLHSLLLHDVPLGDLGPPELDGGLLALRIKVFVDRRQNKKYWGK